VAAPAVNWGVWDQADGSGTPAEWPSLYAQYLTRSAGQSARSLELYQEVMDSIARGELAPTVFQDMLASFVQARGANYTNKLAELSMRFFSGIVQLSTAYSNELAELVTPGSSTAPPPPPPYDPLNPVQWYQQLTGYAGQLSASAAEAYQALLERVASGEVSPGRIQEASSRYLERRLPEHLRRLGSLYFDLLNGLNDLRAGYEEEYLSGILAAARRASQESSFVINLAAPLGETATASLSLANTRAEPAVIRYTVSDVRRADGVGPAFPPKIAFSPEVLELQPGQEASLGISLRLDEGDYEPQVLYVGVLQIVRHGEPRLEVPVRIMASIAQRPDIARTSGRS
jgi:hypothetical protein